MCVSMPYRLLPTVFASTYSYLRDARMGYAKRGSLSI